MTASAVYAQDTSWNQSVPEIDPVAIGSSLTLLVGGALTLTRRLGRS
jgi:hypothetical protein